MILSLDWVDLAGTLQAACGGEPARRSSRCRSIIACTAAGAWTIRVCRPSTASSLPSPIPSSPRCSPHSDPVTHAKRLPHAIRSVRCHKRLRTVCIRPTISPWRSRRGRRKRGAYRSRTCRCRGTVNAGRFAIRSISWAQTVAAASAAVRASPSAPRSRCKDSGVAAHRGVRRRRLPDGRNRAVDCRALPNSAARRRGQQPLVLQRRSAPGTRRAHARIGRSRTSGSASASPIPTSTSPASARAQGATASGPVDLLDALEPALAAAFAGVGSGGVAVVDVRVQPGYTPAMTAALTATTAASRQ